MVTGIMFALQVVITPVAFLVSWRSLMNTPTHLRPSFPSAEVRLTPDDEQLTTRIRAEFTEMPCLSLSAPQAQRLFGMTSQECERTLNSLVRSGFLVNARGLFRRYTTN